MIWHIFKKDWKVLWRFVLGLATVQAIETLMLYRVDRGTTNLMPLTQMIAILGWFGGGLLVAAAVHMDAIPGVRQDWLVRPIRRWDLLAAKLIFVILCVGGPILATSWVGAMAHGFSWDRSFSAALAFSATQLGMYYIPILGFASLTRSAIETIAGVAIGVASFAMLNILPSSIGVLQSVMIIRTGADWLLSLAAVLLLVSGAAGVLSIQYFRRKTLWARSVAAAVGVIVSLVLTLTPWGPVFAIEKRLSPPTGAASPVAVAFQPERGRYKEPLGFQNNLPHWMSARTAIYVPIEITGIPPDDILRVDWISARMRGDFGWVSLGRSNGEQHMTAIYVPDDLYARLQDKKVRVDIDYSLTVLGLAESHAILAIGDQQSVPGAGRCGSTVNVSRTAVQVRCIEAGLAPSCISYFLEHAPSGRRNPEIQRCDANYAPFFAQATPDAMERYGVALPFRDASDLAHYPVDGPQLKESRVVMRIYQSKEHFTRQVVIPDVRLGDWLPQ